jgi:hypothetical protein
MTKFDQFVGGVGSYKSKIQKMTILGHIFYMMWYEKIRHFEEKEDIFRKFTCFCKILRSGHGKFLQVRLIIIVTIRSTHRVMMSRADRNPWLAKMSANRRGTFMHWSKAVKIFVFYTRFIVLLFDQISESNGFSFYNYYKSN